MVLMWGLVLTCFAAVMFFCTPASTSAAVNEAAAWVLALAGAVAASAVLRPIGRASARAAAVATAMRVRGDDMARVPP
jgi:hypothetical protein